MSSSELAISVRGLGKAYTIAHQRDKDVTLREAIMRRARDPLGRRQLETFWALRNVAFDIRQGEVVGVIGHNGAGKSTLLKILSRITEPTEGRIDLWGRVGSLLEVGTGFHRELTGRENIYLNGSILGMKRREIDRVFDAIVDFAGVEKFLDTPVKRYSSGMYVRLAFAVAAHLEPEILIVDEVLAVGDASFQQKCLDKMKEVSTQGRTVLFVSHNMGAIQALCQRAIVLRSGQVATDSDVDSAVAEYLRQVQVNSQIDLAARTDRAGAGRFKLVGAMIRNAENHPTTHLMAGYPATFEFEVNEVHPSADLAFNIYDHLGRKVAGVTMQSLTDQDTRGGNRNGHARTFVCHFDELLLRPGHYRINTRLNALGELQDHVEGAISFHVEAGQVRGRIVPEGTGTGQAFIPYRWELPV